VEKGGASGGKGRRRQKNIRWWKLNHAVKCRGVKGRWDARWSNTFLKEKEKILLLAGLQNRTKEPGEQEKAV